MLLNTSDINVSTPRKRRGMGYQIGMDLDRIRMKSYVKSTIYHILVQILTL